MKSIITYQDFDKLDLRVGTVIACERKEGSEKILRMTVEFGEEGIKIILSGIYPFYHPENILNKSFIFILNLAPRKIMNEESQGMILATDGEKPVLFNPQENVPSGTMIR